MILSAVMISTSCAAESEPAASARPTIPNLQAFNEDQLREFLSDRGLVSALAASARLSHVPSESFLNDGTYYRWMGRVSVQGRFAIEGSRVCVFGGNIPRLCRALIPLGGQFYLWLNDADGSQELVAIQE
jgi:hypothetical protein